MRKDFECEKDRWVGIWKKDPESLCVKQKNMKHHAAVQALSSQMMADYGVNLRYVSSDAIRPWMALSDKTETSRSIKQAAFELILKAIKEDKNPLTGEYFGDSEFGLTEEIVQSFIRYVRTGCKTKRQRNFIKLYGPDIWALRFLLDNAIKRIRNDSSDTPMSNHYQTRIKLLHDKICCGGLP